MIAHVSVFHISPQSALMLNEDLLLRCIMILRFHLFVSLLHSDLLPNLVQSGLWHLQIIASFEEHFFHSADSHPGPRPRYGCLYSAIVLRPFWPSYFWQHLFNVSQDPYQVITMNVAHDEWKVSILQWCHTQAEGDYLHTFIWRDFFLSLSNYCLTSQSSSHNKM